MEETVLKWPQQNYLCGCSTCRCLPCPVPLIPRSCQTKLGELRVVVWREANRRPLVIDHSFWIVMNTNAELLQVLWCKSDKQCKQRLTRSTRTQFLYCWGGQKCRDWESVQCLSEGIESHEHVGIELWRERHWHEGQYMPHQDLSVSGGSISQMHRVIPSMDLNCVMFGMREKWCQCRFITIAVTKGRTAIFFCTFIFGSAQIDVVKDWWPNPSMRQAVNRLGTRILPVHCLCLL